MIGSVLLIVSTLASGLLLRRRLPGVFFGICSFWLTLLPVSNVIPTMQFLAERFLYLPLFGLAVIVASVLTVLRVHETAQSTPGSSAAGSSLEHRRLLFSWLFTGIAFMAFALSSLTRLPAWRDNFSLFSRTYADGIQSGRTAYSYSRGLIERQRYSEAAEILERLAASPAQLNGRIPPVRLHHALGVVYMRLGRSGRGTLPYPCSSPDRA